MQALRNGLVCLGDQGRPQRQPPMAHRYRAATRRQHDHACPQLQQPKLGWTSTRWALGKQTAPRRNVALAACQCQNRSKRGRSLQHVARSSTSRRPRVRPRRHHQLLLPQRFHPKERHAMEVRLMPGASCWRGCWSESPPTSGPPCSRQIPLRVGGPQTATGTEYRLLADWHPTLDVYRKAPASGEEARSRPAPQSPPCGRQLATFHAQQRWMRPWR
mmetsp:Transcript_17048/g.64547  ORF Transcript_17048/g.64547 Transcript_17048/m.64547 type:complete len:217 (-) Transcript_17048:2438-3088(-)